jgi:hypothetical protein
MAAASGLILRSAEVEQEMVFSYDLWGGAARVW